MVAVLYDVTSGAGAPLDTGILDFSGWAGASFHFGQSVAQATPVAQFLIKDIDDSGTPVQIDLWYSPTAAGAVAFRVTLGRGVSAGQTSTNGDTSSYSLGRLSKRSRATTATTALAVSRIRIEVDR